MMNDAVSVPPGDPHQPGRRWWTPGVIVTVALVSVLVLVFAGVLWWVFSYTSQTKITAYFNRAVGIYDSSDVRMLGVKVGTIDSVTPMGDRVKVTMRVDGDVTLPEDVRAVQVAPSLVADRYVQLTPAYVAGKPKAGKEIQLDLDKTMEPMEVDELYKSVQQLTAALGPQGADKNGALSDLVDTTAANLSDNGEKLGQSIEDLSKAARTLSESSGNIVDTIKNLNSFVGMLRENDAQVRKFNSQMANFTEFAAGERQQFGETLKQLSLALGDVADFVGQNREKLGDRVKELLPTTKLLADTKAQQNEILEQLPLALINLTNAYDAESGTLQMRVDFPDLQDLLGAQCRSLDPRNLKPGDPTFEALYQGSRPILQACEKIAKAVKNGVKTPQLNLPFGLMSGDNLQKNPVPGTKPGIVKPDPATGGER